MKLLNIGQNITELTPIHKPRVDIAGLITEAEYQAELNLIRDTTYESRYSVEMAANMVLLNPQLRDTIIPMETINDAVMHEDKSNTSTWLKLIFALKVLGGEKLIRDTIGSYHVDPAELKRALYNSSNHTSNIFPYVVTMAANYKILMPPRFVDDDLDTEVWDLLVEVLEHYESSGYSENLCRVLARVRIAWPQRFASLNLNNFIVNDPKLVVNRFRQTIITAGVQSNFVELINSLRIIHAAEIKLTPFGIDIIDSLETSSNGDDLPINILYS